MGGAEPMRLVEHRDLQFEGPLPEPDVVPPHLAPLERLDIDADSRLPIRVPRTGSEDVSFPFPRDRSRVITGTRRSGQTTLLLARSSGLVKADGGTVSWNGEIVEQPDRFFIPPRSAYTPQVPRPVLDEPHGEPADGSHRSCRGRG